MATNPTNQMNLRSLLEKEKLNDSNFLDWYRNLRIVLKFEGKFDMIEQPLPESLANGATIVVLTAHRRAEQEQEKVALLMIASMTPDLQKDMEDRTTYEMMTELKNMFQKHASQEVFETVKLLYACKMEESQSVSSHVLKLKSYIDMLDRLEVPLSNVLASNLVLSLLPKSFDNFVMNHNMKDHRLETKKVVGNNEF